MAEKFEITSSHDFWASIDDPEAAAIWHAILGRIDRIPVLSPIPQDVELEGLGRTLCYMLHLELLSEQERSNLVGHFAARSGVPAPQVAAEIAEQGLPIRASTASVMCLNPQRWV